MAAARKAAVRNEQLQFVFTAEMVSDSLNRNINTKIIPKYTNIARVHTVASCYSGIPETKMYTRLRSDKGW